MNNERGKSSDNFISRLSLLERSVFDSFTSLQRSPGLKTFCVFQQAFSPRVHCLGVPADSPLASHVDWNMEQDNNRYNILLLAMDLRRSFESQWPYQPGLHDYSLERFAGRPLITVHGLESSRYVDHENAVGKGLRSAFLRLVSSTEEPSILPAAQGQKEKPKLVLHRGFRP